MSRIVIDMNGAIERMGDRDLYIVIATSFAEMLPETLAEIDAEITAKNWPEARRLVHSLKGNCAAMGADETRERVYALEKACNDGNEPLITRLHAPLCEEMAELREALLALQEK
ncbi:MAG: hypothetical protein DELT_00282 [Desulfovibrio sp.]